MLKYGCSNSHSPEKLLFAAKTALLLQNITSDILWKLFSDELLAICDDDHQHILKYLAMGFADEFSSPENQDDPDNSF